MTRTAEVLYEPTQIRRMRIRERGFYLYGIEHEGEEYPFFTNEEVARAKDLGLKIITLTPGTPMPSGGKSVLASLLEG